MRTLVSISYCASHHKGADPDVAPRLDGAEHAEWLQDAVGFYAALLPTAEIAVAATAFPGILDVPAGRERDAYWTIIKCGVLLVTTSHNPGHQVGAALAIRLGLEAAGKLGFDFLVHTAEDVIPGEGALQEMLTALASEADYAGSEWHAGPGQVNAQFFACRTQALVARWDACAVTGDGCIERYLGRLLEGRPKCLREWPYRHTHDRAEWQRWARGQ